MNDAVGNASPRTVRGSTLLYEANQLLTEGKGRAATQKVVEHLRRFPNDARGVALLGKIAAKDGALAQGEHFLRQAIRLGDTSYETKLEFASALLRGEVLDEALHVFSVLDESYDDPNVTATRAMVLDRLGRHEEAIAVHRDAIAKRPTDLRFRITFGHSLRFAGRTDEAVAVYREVVNDDPERGEAWWALADVKTNALTDDDIGQMQKALTYAVDPLNIVPMRKALGKAMNDRGMYAEAFEQYREANRIRAEIAGYDSAQLTRDVDKMIEYTSRVPLAPPAPPPSPGGPTPIFIVNLPRSGSTLLEQILDQHSEIEARGEMTYILALVCQTLERHIRQGVGDVIDLLRLMGSEERSALGQEYLRRASLHQIGNSRFFIDKMPSNWSEILFVQAILPHARFIAIRRNGFDCCLSNHFHHFGRAHAASYNLVDQGQAYFDFSRLMDHLVTTSPDALVYVRYEELVEDPDKVLRQVLDYLDLEWEDGLLEFHQSKRNVRTPSAEQVREPLTRKGIGNWRHYEQFLGPLREALGPYADD